MDSLACGSVSSATSSPCTSCLVPGHHLWASKSGCHVLGLVEDYDALCKQIADGQKLLAEMGTQVREASGSTSQELGTKVTCPTELEGDRCSPRTGVDVLAEVLGGRVHTCPQEGPETRSLEIAHESSEVKSSLGTFVVFCGKNTCWGWCPAFLPSLPPMTASVHAVSHPSFYPSAPRCVRPSFIYPVT